VDAEEVIHFCWDWEDAQSWDWDKKCGYSKAQLSEGELFGTVGDEFDLLELSQNLNKRREVANILHVERNQPWSAKGLNTFFDVAKEGGFDVIRKLQQEKENREFTAMIVEMMETKLSQEDFREESVIEEAEEKKPVRPKSKRELKRDEGEEYVPEKAGSETEDEEDDEEEEAFVLEEEDDANYEEEGSARRKRKKGYNLDGKKRAKHLFIKDIMKNTEDRSLWSQARQTAFSKIKTAPNAYYYRFNAPNEQAASGPWSSKAFKCFMERLKLLGANQEWGIFSKSVPGRVGYGCSQFWRNLQKAGWAWDMNYWKDKQLKKGCLTLEGSQNLEKCRRFDFVLLADPSGTFKDFPAFHRKADPEFVKRFKSHPLLLSFVREKKHAQVSDLPCRDMISMPGKDFFRVHTFPGNLKKVKKKKVEKKKPAKRKQEAAPEKSAKKRKTKRVRKPARETKKYYHQSEDEKDEEFSVSVRRKRRRSSIADPVLPGFCDPVTGLDLERPSISPYGHVMEHDTWTKLLYMKNVCPITGKKLSRRDLIRLTKKNIEKYRDKIISLTDDQIMEVTEDPKDTDESD